MSEQTDPVVESSFGYKLAVEEARRMLDEQSRGFETSRSVAQQALAAAGLVLVLAGWLPIARLPDLAVPRQVLALTLIGVSILLYTLLIALCVASMSMAHVHGPVAVDWEEMYLRLVLPGDEIAVLKSLLSSQINAFEKNIPLTSRRASLANWTLKLLPIIVILLLAATLAAYVA